MQLPHQILLHFLNIWKSCETWFLKRRKVIKVRSGEYGNCQIRAMLFLAKNCFTSNGHWNEALSTISNILIVFTFILIFNTLIPTVWLKKIQPKFWFNAHHPQNWTVDRNELIYFIAVIDKYTSHLWKSSSFLLSCQLRSKI